MGARALLRRSPDGAEPRDPCDAGRRSPVDRAKARSDAASRRPARNRRHACPRRRTGRDAAWLRAPRAPATDGACRRADPGAQRHAAGRGRHRDGQEHRVPRAVARSRSPPEGTRGGLDAHSHAAGAADEQGPSGPVAAALGLQGVFAQRPLELHIVAALAPLPRRAVRERGGASLQAEGAGVAAHH